MSGIRAKERAINKAIKARAGSAACVPKITVGKGGARTGRLPGVKAA